MTTFALAAAVAAVVIAVAVFVWAIIRDRRPDPVDAAYHSLPAGRPELHINTATGSHDTYPQMTDNVRRIVTDYCEAMWQYSTQEQP